MASERATMPGMELKLDVAPRIMGRAKQSQEATFVRALTPTDLEGLQTEVGLKAPNVVKLRERHHALARVLALGYTDAQASAHTGYVPSRISILKSDPAFKDLVDSYVQTASIEVMDFQTRAVTLANAVVTELHERLEEKGDELSEHTLMEMGKFAADRSGYAPQTKAVNININTGLAQRMEEARQKALERRRTVDADFKVVT